jgi:hypothetical protein
MGAMLVWPVTALLGFLVCTGAVVALGVSSTARYEFERNAAALPQRSAAHSSGAHPAGRRVAGRPIDPAHGQARSRAVGVAVRPVPATGAAPRWWLVGESAQVLAGPFDDRLDADWAALADGLPAVSVFGARRADGSVAPRPCPEERAWLRELGEQLARLPEEWETLLTDTDPLTTLVVEVAAALVEAGLPLHDGAGDHPAGGVSLLPEPGCGVLVSWRPHDRLSLRDLGGATAGAAVQQLMSATVADVLTRLGFVVEPCDAGACVLVTALR